MWIAAAEDFPAATYLCIVKKSFELISLAAFTRLWVNNPPMCPAIPHPLVSDNQDVIPFLLSLKQHPSFQVAFFFLIGHDRKHDPAQKCCTDKRYQYGLGYKVDNYRCNHQNDNCHTPNPDRIPQLELRLTRRRQ